jgi:hypothetical protein
MHVMSLSVGLGALLIALVGFISQDPSASAVLSAVLGCPVLLARAQPRQHHRAEIDPATVFGDVPVETLKPRYTAATLPDSFALPPGTFFDAACIRLVTSGTFADLRPLMSGDAQVDARRFRPTIFARGLKVSHHRCRAIRLSTVPRDCIGSGPNAGGGTRRFEAAS